MNLKAGLEIHQQLNTKKLFCDCESEINDNIEGTFTRRLKTAKSEIGEVDQAALTEEIKQRLFVYRITENSCLVEADEEPPHPCNEEAIDVALTIAIMMNATIMDEIQFMRKIVIDGSNTTGFQRTALLAVDGYLDFPFGRISIPTICLEEEAARKIEEKENEVTYQLDRLGIPLIELATGPDIKNSEQVKIVAQRIGNLLRATKKVRRGQSTIRQDLNISIEGGARVEIKGVQELNLLATFADNEVKRQRMLLNIKEKLKSMEIKTSDIMNITHLMKNCKSKIIQDGIKKGGVYAIVLYGFRGLLKNDDYRFGAELAGYAKTLGIKGIFHSDELPSYGISQEEVDTIKNFLEVGKNDAFVMVSEKEKISILALKKIIKRTQDTPKGVIEETRGPKDDGTTTYMRPLAGKARMYPETDIPPIIITKERINKLKKSLPEMPENKIERFVKNYKIAKQQAEQLIRDGNDDLFEELVSKHGNPSIIVRTLLNTLPELDMELETSIPRLNDILNLYNKGKFAKEAIAELLKIIKEKDIAAEEALKLLGIEIKSMDEIEQIIDNLIVEKKQLIKEKGERALPALMGLVMKELRGKIDGKIVNDILKKKLKL